MVPEEVGRWESRETQIFCKKIFTFRQRYFSQPGLCLPDNGDHPRYSGSHEVPIGLIPCSPDQTPGIDLHSMFSRPDSGLKVCFKASATRQERRMSSGRESHGALKPWHTPDRQRPGSAGSSGKGARRDGHKDFRKDPSSGRQRQLHAGSRLWAQPDAAPPSADRGKIHTEFPPRSARAQNPISPHPLFSISPSTDCRSRTPRQRAPAVWTEGANP